MAAVVLTFFGALGSTLGTRGGLVLENLALRQQLVVFERHDPRPRLTHPERLLWIALSRVWSRWREAILGRPSSARIQRHHDVSARRRSFGEAQAAPR
jgi:hypothetical protein